jgi:hypothetical protein
VGIIRNYLLIQAVAFLVLGVAVNQVFSKSIHSKTAIATSSAERLMYGNLRRLPGMSTKDLHALFEIGTTGKFQEKVSGIEKYRLNQNYTVLFSIANGHVQSFCLKSEPRQHFVVPDTRVTEIDLTEQPNSKRLNSHWEATSDHSPRRKFRDECNLWSRIELQEKGLIGMSTTELTELLGNPNFSDQFTTDGQARRLMPTQDLMPGYRLDNHTNVFFTIKDGLITCANFSSSKPYTRPFEVDQ